MTTPVGGMPRVSTASLGGFSTALPNIHMLRAMVGDPGQHQSLLGILQFNPPPYIRVDSFQSQPGREPVVLYQHGAYQEGAPPAVRRATISDFLRYYDHETYRPREAVKNWFYGEVNEDVNALLQFVGDARTGWLTRDELRFILMNRSLWPQVFRYLQSVPSIEALGDKYTMRSFDNSSGKVSYMRTVQGPEDMIVNYRESMRLNEFVESLFVQGPSRVVEDDPSEHFVVIHWGALGIDPQLRHPGREVSQAQPPQPLPPTRSLYVPAVPRGPVEVGGEMTVGQSQGSLVAMMAGSRAADLVSGGAARSLSSGSSIRMEASRWTEVGNHLRFDAGRQCNVFTLPRDGDWYVLSRYNAGAQWDNDPRVKASFERLVGEMNSKNNGQSRLVLVPIRDDVSTQGLSRLHVMIRRIGEDTWQIRALHGDVSILNNNYTTVERQLSGGVVHDTTFISPGQRIILAPGVVIEMSR